MSVLLISFCIFWNEEYCEYSQSRNTHKWQNAPSNLCLKNSNPVKTLFFVGFFRGLDVHPQTLSRFAAQEDTSSVKILEVIYADEITHVAAGLRWFTYICSKEERVRNKCHLSHVWFCPALLHSY